MLFVRIDRTDTEQCLPTACYLSSGTLLVWVSIFHIHPAIDRFIGILIQLTTGLRVM